jgi:hypothetical protein
VVDTSRHIPLTIAPPGGPAAAAAAAAVGTWCRAPSCEWDVGAGQREAGPASGPMRCNVRDDLEPEAEAEADGWSSYVLVPLWELAAQPTLSESGPGPLCAAAAGGM